MNVGGVERSFLSLSEQLMSKGHEVSIVTLNQSKSGMHFNEKIEIIYIDSSKTSYSLLRLRKILYKNKPDILISAQYYANIISVIASKLSKHKVKIILSERLHLSTTLKQYSFTKRLILKILVKLTYNHSDLIYGNSESVCNDLKSNFVNGSKKVVKIYNPSFSQKIIHLSKEKVNDAWISESKDPIILYVGRLSKQKDMWTLIKVFENILNKIDSKLLIIGDGPEKKSIETYLSKNTKIANRIKMTGNDHNPYKYFKYSKVFLLTSLYEGLPNVLIESQILNLPIVATNSPGGTAEVVEYGKSGYLAELNNHEDLSNKVLKVLSNEISIKELKKNMSLSVKRFNPSYVTDQLIDHIENI